MRETNSKRDIFLPLVHFPDGCYSWPWPGPSLEPGGYTGLLGGCRGPRAWAILHSFLRLISRELEVEQPGFKPTPKLNVSDAGARSALTL